MKLSRLRRLLYRKGSALGDLSAISSGIRAGSRGVASIKSFGAVGAVVSLSFPCPLAMWLLIILAFAVILGIATAIFEEQTDTCTTLGHVL